jgi:hypothetical protein
LYINKREGPYYVVGTYEKDNQEIPYIELEQPPIFYPDKKIFIFEFDRKSV